MRRLAALLLSVTLAWGAAPPRPDQPDLITHVRLANRQLLNLPEKDRKYMRFISWQSLATHPSLPTWKRIMVWWLNQMSTSEASSFPTSVPGSVDLLWMVDIRSYRWNEEAWRTVAQREPYFREPWIPHADAQLMREMLDEKAIEKNDTIHVVGVVRADWLFRDTLETDRSTSYYDLLYARQRFIQKKADFPKDEDDWNAFFGVTEVTKFLAKQKVNLLKGAVVAGSNDDPVRGSLVARNNRVVTILNSPYGVAMKTFDANKTAEKTDFIEFPVEVSVGKIQFDAGELLASLPNGGQAGLLINGEGKRIEFATGKNVHPKFIDKRTPDVRTMMGCVVCHAPEGGLIPPRDQFTEGLKAGIDLKLLKPEERDRVRGFFLNWRRRIKGWQEPYYALIDETTSDPVRGAKSLPPAILVKEYLALRDWYDDPVSVRQAAVEFGLSEPDLRILAASNQGALINGKRVGSFRFGQIAQGKEIPRAAFEARVYRELNLVRESYKVRKIPKLPSIKIRKAG